MIYILIAALWVIYGAFSIVQDKEVWKDSSGDTNEIGKFLFYMILSPLIFVVKALYGIFRTYNNKN